MDDKNPVGIPFVVHEAIADRQERTIKRLWILCIVIFAAFVLSNLAWLIYEAQFETVVTTQEVSQSIDGEGSNNFVGGDYFGGIPESDNNDTPKG